MPLDHVLQGITVISGSLLPWHSYKYYQSSLNHLLPRLEGLTLQKLSHVLQRSLQFHQICQSQEEIRTAYCIQNVGIPQTFLEWRSHFFAISKPLLKMNITEEHIMHLTCSSIFELKYTHEFSPMHSQQKDVCLYVIFDIIQLSERSKYSARF